MKLQQNIKIISILIITIIGMIVCGCNLEKENSQTNFIKRQNQIEKMNLVNPESINYDTYCIKNKKVLYVFHTMMFDLDENGKPIPCEIK